jgi:hypothetical protein
MTGVDGYATPAEAAMATMPATITHVVEVDEKPGGTRAYVLLAIEVAGTGFYLDENLCERAADGSWWQARAREAASPTAASPTSARTRRRRASPSYPSA